MQNLDLQTSRQTASYQEADDRKILSIIKDLVAKERECLVEILRLLREVERRKLFSDLGYKSLFDYTVKELKYSEGQAGRRIQAMRLLKELPQLEHKIQSGTLSLTNISQAQTHFREVQAHAAKSKGLNAEVPTGDNSMRSDTFRSNPPRNSVIEKINLLEKLENKSAREGQKVLLQVREELGALPPFPKEQQRQVSAELLEIRFVADLDLMKKLETCRSLLGKSGATMSYGELIGQLAEIGIEAWREKKFGRKRVADSSLSLESKSRNQNAPSGRRYISKQLQFEVWTRDDGKCTKCAGTRNLQIDHQLPLAMGGESTSKNLRLLCHHCNQREGMRAGLISCG